MTSRRQIYLVLNRWSGIDAEYDRFIGVGWRDIAFITTEDGVPALRGARADHLCVTPSLDLDAVLPVARQLAQRGPGVAGVVGLSEYDLATAARLRELLSIPGHQPDFVHRFKDKVAMKAAVAVAGLRIPRHLALGLGVTAQDVVEKIKPPVVLKPRQGAASSGVVVARDTAAVSDELARVDLAAYECEEFVTGDILHVDGVRRAGTFHFVSASAYVNTCLGFANGTPLGSVLLEPSVRRDRVIAFAAACLDALGLDDGPFHLELIEKPMGELVFLEVGLRPGGGEITPVHLDLFGINLVGEAIRAMLGLPPLATEFATVRSGGFVMVPEPGPFPCRIVDRNSLLDTIPELYNEILPSIGELYDGSGGYDHIGGKFHLRGDSEAAVRMAVHRIINGYRVVSEPVPALEPVSGR